jgi:hypothetical protein
MMPNMALEQSAGSHSLARGCSPPAFGGHEGVW